MTEAYTVSKMINSINKVMAPVATETCASVTLQRKSDNGVMLNTLDKEIAYLDTKARVKHSAQQVARLDAPAKAQWVAARRLAGNDAFRRREFQQAAEAYIQALTALDFGNTPEAKRACQQELQIPLTCNLAACMLMLEQWEKARQMCNQVLELDSDCIKALQQRSKAKAKLASFDEARADIKRAVQVARGPTVSSPIERETVVRSLDKQLDDVARLEQRHKRSLQQQRQFQKKMMKEAVGRLYWDKKEVVRSPDTSNHLQQQLSYAALVSRSTWDAGIAWALAVMALVLSALYRLVGGQHKEKTA